MDANLTGAYNERFLAGLHNVISRAELLCPSCFESPEIPFSECLDSLDLISLTGLSDHTTLEIGPWVIQSELGGLWNSRTRDYIYTWRKHYALLEERGGRIRYARTLITGQYACGTHQGRDVRWSLFRGWYVNVTHPESDLGMPIQRLTPYAKTIGFSAPLMDNLGAARAMEATLVSAPASKRTGVIVSVPELQVLAMTMPGYAQPKDLSGNNLPFSGQYASSDRTLDPDLSIYYVNPVYTDILH